MQRTPARGRRPGAKSFSEEMELVAPWKALPEVIEPFYPMAGRGRRPYPLESSLRVRLMQNRLALLEDNDLAEDIFKRVSAHLARKGLLLKRGSIVDATIIAAPSSTNNAGGERDPALH